MDSSSQPNTACLLKSCMNCSDSEAPLTVAGPDRLNSIVAASKLRGDGLHASLTSTLQDTSRSLFVHRNCASTYTSKTHIKRFLQKQSKLSEEPDVKRFKASVAHAAAQSQELTGLKECSSGLVQTIADNFDANISTQNGLQSTHALAILVTQIQQGERSDLESTNIRRLRKEEMPEEVMPVIPVQRYRGPSKPEMPVNIATRSPLPLKVLAAQRISAARAKLTDFMFFKSVVTDAETPEYHGYNTRISWEQGHSVRPATKAIYLPLLDMTPAEPDTMYTAMVEAQRLTNQTGQVYTIFTNDQQLYRVVVHVTWVYQSQFQNFIPRLGGMHTLMNFVGAVGVLMADTGLETILQVAFGGVASMLSGKKYPQNIRALRLLTEELLRGTIVHMDSHDSLMKVLDNKSQESRTTKLWVENLIKPVMLMMMFVRAERESRLATPPVPCEGDDALLLCSWTFQLREV